MAATVQGKNQKDTIAEVTKNVRVIISQEEVATIEEIPDLHEHQKAAKDHSNTWENDIWPLIIKTTAEILDYANTFTNAHDQLNGLIPKLEEGDFQAKIDFVAILQEVLIRALKEKSETAMFIVESISTFQTSFESLSEKFKTDFEAVSSLLTKDNQKILDKQANLATWKVKAFRHKMAVVAAGITLALTAAAIDFYATSGNELLIGGVLMACQCTALAVFLLKYAGAKRQVNDLTSQLNELNSKRASLTLIESQIDGLQTATDLFVTTSKGIAKGWRALKDHLEDTVRSLQRIKPQNVPGAIEEDMRPAKTAWGVVLKKAKALQPDSDDDCKTDLKTSGDMVKAINDQAVKAKGA